MNKNEFFQNTSEITYTKKCNQKLIKLYPCIYFRHLRKHKLKMIQL